MIIRLYQVTNVWETNYEILHSFQNDRVKKEVREKLLPWELGCPPSFYKVDQRMGDYLGVRK